MNRHRIKNISVNHLSEEQMLNYHEGNMNAKEKHLVEMHLLHCEFCKDASDGFASINLKDAEAILDELNAEINERVGNKRVKIGYRSMGIAASVILLIGASMLFLLNHYPKDDLKSQDRERATSLNKDDRADPSGLDNSTEDKVQSGRPLLPYSDQKSAVGEDTIETFASSTTGIPSRAKDLSVPEIDKEKEDYKGAGSEAGVLSPFTLNPVSEGITMNSFISGRVTDETGEPLPGTKITINGNDIVAITDKDGFYSISTSSLNDVDSIAFSSVGFKGNSIYLSEKENVRDIALVSDTTGLTQVVVAGIEKESKQYNSIDLAPNTELKVSKPMLFPIGQGNAISGRVFAEDGGPLAGVSVQIKGTSKGAITDNNGNYSLPLPTLDSKLVFSYIGYSTEELAINNLTSKTKDVVLVEDRTSLSEVVVMNSNDAETKESKKIIKSEPLYGELECQRFIKDNLKFSEAAIANKIEGTIELEFLVDVRGAISNIVVKKTLGYGIDEEVVKLIESGPNWKLDRRDDGKDTQKVELIIPIKAE